MAALSDRSVATLRRSRRMPTQRRVGESQMTATGGPRAHAVDPKPSANALNTTPQNCPMLGSRASIAGWELRSRQALEPWLCEQVSLKQTDAVLDKEVVL